MRILAIAALFAATLAAQPKRILYITHSAGFAHGSIPHSVDVLLQIAQQSGQLEINATDDVSQINAANLANYDAVLFFTSGELPISDQQKADLLAFVRAGKGFGGFHSATDTFYQWPEYGELIGGYFNGHPWTQEVNLEVEDPQHPMLAQLGGSLRVTDEIYQFRDFSRERARVLLKLDASTVDLSAPGVNPNTIDFPLVWTKPYGQGRVFYSALGHFDEVWDQAEYRQLLHNAMLYLTGAPQMAALWIGNSADFQPLGEISPGSAFTIFGENLTAGGTAAGDPRNPPFELAGSSLEVNGQSVPLFFASPSQINAYLPFGIEPAGCDGSPFCDRPRFDLRLTTPSYAALTQVRARTFTPGVFTYTRAGDHLTFWATGLGPVHRDGGFERTNHGSAAMVGPHAAVIQYSGLAPGWFGLYQVNVEIPAGTVFPAVVTLYAAERTFQFNVP